MKTYCGKDEGRRVVDWLNGVQYPIVYSKGRSRDKNTKASRARVQDLIATIQELQLALAKIPNYREGDTRYRKIEALLNEIDERLEDYPTLPYILAEDGGLLFADRVVAGNRPRGESIAALAIVELVGLRRIDRIALCLCGKVYSYKFMWSGETIRESTKQGNQNTARNIESAHRTSLANGLVGIREKKTAPTLKEFCDTRFEPWAKSTFARTRRQIGFGSVAG